MKRLSIVKIVTISILLVFAFAIKSYAATSTSGINMNNIDFVNIPETSTTTSSTTGAAEAVKKAEEEAAAKKAAAASKSTTSSSSSKMPDTGSNVEVVFMLVVFTLISGAVYFFKKQDIKLK